MAQDVFQLALGVAFLVIAFYYSVKNAESAHKN